MADFSTFCAVAAGGDSLPWIARFDLPGFGTSPAPQEPAGSQEYARIVAVAIGQVVSSMPDPASVKVVGIGHSFGGRIAISLTSLSQYGFELVGLLLTGVPLLRSQEMIPKPKTSFRIARFLSRYGLISNSRMETLRSRYGSTDYRNAAGVMRGVLVKVVNEDYSELLERLEIPVSLLWGTDDLVAPLAVAERAMMLCPRQVSLQTVPGDHFIAVSSPKVLLDAVEDLVQRTTK
ncbi:MAG: alpha/beta hydrolase [Acidimicrobiaceae bacterium]|nr:alpha/beta hydrolase [Acidimicrobiaceae bacterium]